LGETKPKYLAQHLKNSRFMDQTNKQSDFQAKYFSAATERLFSPISGGALKN